MKKFITLLAVLFSFVISAQSTLTGSDDNTLAFKGAYGAGAYVKDWVNKNIYKVTNCNPSGTGSFSSALGSANANGGVIVFEVGCENGIEVPSSWMQITGKQGIYIAGQTAPGKIIVTGSRFRGNQCDNVVMRYITIAPNYTGEDAFEFISSEDIMVDHVSVRWGGDEAFSTRAYTGDPVQNVTFQNMFIQSSKTGTLFGDSSNPSLASNLSAIRLTYFNISHRVPNINASGRADVINILNWDWQSRLTFVNGNSQLNHINNYHATGSRTTIGNSRHKASTAYTHAIYSDGNYVDKGLFALADDDRTLWDQFNGGQGGVDLGFENFVGSQYTLLGNAVPILSTLDVPSTLLADTGNSRHLDDNHNIVLSWDPIDTDYRNIMLAGEGSNIPYENDPETFTSEQRYIDFHNLPHGTVSDTRPANWDTDDDGMPDSWENTEYGNLTQGAWDDFDSDGWYNIEEYLGLVDVGSGGSPGASYSASNITGNTTEAGAGSPQTFTVVLNTQPTTDVVIDVSSNDTTEGTVSPSSLTFTNANYNTPQTVTVTGVDDALQDGNITYGAVLSINDASSDDEFDPLADITVSVINEDDEGTVIPITGIGVSPNNPTIEVGQSVVLNVTYFPSNTTQTGGTWSNSNSSVATMVVAGDNLSATYTAVAPGTTVGNFTSTTGGFNNPETITVNAATNTAPSVSLIGNSVVNLTVGAVYTEQGATWTDNEDGTGSILTPTTGSVPVNGSNETTTPGQYVLTYTYTDASSQSDTAVRTVNVTASGGTVIRAKSGVKTN